jgi:uncharacterized protein (DUF2147 family)
MSDRRLWAAAALAAIAMASGPAARAAADPVFGDWLTVDGAAKVRVGPCAANAALTCGTLLWLKDGKDAAGGPKHDANNPDPALRSRALVGLQIISDMKREAPGVWKDGRMYVVGTGRTSRGNLAVGADGALKVEGCVAVLCQAKTWTRVR